MRTIWQSNGKKCHFTNFRHNMFVMWKKNHFSLAEISRFHDWHILKNNTFLFDTVKPHLFGIVWYASEE